LVKKEDPKNGKLEKCEEEVWGSGSFWKITGQDAFNWKDTLCNKNGENPGNPGTGWCICMWATARLISSAGCDAVHLDCDATDVDYVLSKYTDGGTNLQSAHECLMKKCRGS